MAAPRLGLVLSAGGLRGAAHLGVLRQLFAHGIRPEVMVGVSAGAVISAFHAAVGLPVDELIAEARGFRGRHLLAHGLRLRMPEFLQTRLAPYCGIIPHRLEQLDQARFDRLSFGVRGLGIVCHDTLSGRPIYFCSGSADDAPLSPVVRASASIPWIMPARRLRWQERDFRLVDGGVSDSLPVDFARRAPLGATHLIVSDCRSDPQAIPVGPNVVYLRPELKGTRSLSSPRESLAQAVTEGEATVTPEVLATVRAWLR